MAISFGISTASASPGANSLTLARPTAGDGSAPVTGDVIVIFGGGADPSTAMSVTGSTFTVAKWVDINTNAGNLGISYRVCNGTEPANFTVALSGNGGGPMDVAAILARGCDTTTPLGLTGTLYNQNDGGANNPDIGGLAVTATIAGQFAIWAGAGVGNNFTTSTSVTSTASAGEFFDINSAGGSPANRRVMAAYRSSSRTVGQLTDPTISWSESGSNRVAAIFHLNPSTAVVKHWVGHVPFG